MIFLLFSWCYSFLIFLLLLTFLNLPILKKDLILLKSYT